MADYEVGVRLVARDETGPAVASAESHMKGLDQAAKGANKELEGMGPAATKGARGAEPALNGLKNSLGDIAKMAISFSIGGVINQLGGSLTGALTESIDKAKEFNSQVKSLQMVTGGTPEELSSMVSAFERFGVSSDAATRSISIFARQMQKAPVDIAELGSGIDSVTGKPLKGFADAMHDLGVNTEDATGKTRPMVDVLMDTADKFKGMGQGAEATAAAMTLFGRSGRDMLPLLIQGRAGIQATAEEAAKMGLQLTSQNMAQIKAFSMANKDLGEAMNGLKLQIGIALMPILTALAQIGANLAQIFNQSLMPAIRVVAEWIGKAVAAARDAFQRFTEWAAPLGGLVDKLKEFAGGLLDTEINGRKLSDILGDLATGAVATGAAMTIAGIGADKLGDAIDFAGNAAQTLTSIFSAGVWGTVFAIFVLIGAAAYVAYQNITWFRDIVNALGTALTSDAGALGVVYDVLRDTFGEEFANQVRPALDWLMTAIPLVSDFWNAWVEAFTGDRGALGVVYDILKKLFGADFADKLRPTLQWLMDRMPDIRQVGRFLLNAFQDLLHLDLRNFLIDLGLAFSSLTGIDMSGFAQFVGNLADKFEELKTSAWNWFVNDALPKLRDLLSTIGDFLGSTVLPRLGDLKDAIGAGFQRAWQLWLDMWPGIQKAMGDVMSFITTEVIPRLNDLKSYIADRFKEAWDWAVNTAWPKLQDGFNETTRILREELLPQLQNLADKLKPLLQTSWQAATDALDGFNRSLQDSAPLAEDVSKKYGPLSAVLAPLVGIANDLGAIWRDLGIILSGVGDVVGRLIRTLQGLPEQLLGILAIPFFPFAAQLIGFLQGMQLGFDALRKILDILAESAPHWGEAFDNLGATFSNLGTTIHNLPETIRAAFAEVTQAFTNFATDIQNRLKAITFDIGPLHYKGGAWTFDRPGENLFNIGGGGGGSAPTTTNAVDVTDTATPESMGITLGRARGGYLPEPIIGVGPSGTQYKLHAGEYVAPAGVQASAAAARNEGNGGIGSITLNVHPGAVQISGANGPAEDWAVAADALWDDLYAKLSRALANRVGA